MGLVSSKDDLYVIDRFFFCRRRGTVRELTKEPKETTRKFDCARKEKKLSFWTLTDRGLLAPDVVPSWRS